MPPAAKPKKSVPKAPGTVRAKSGCYTCRIRRKKCDEKPNEDGYCQTCVRLRLQCLGFGAKRPDWLRENRRVLELREKIKTFLASQGMIKGHSAAGPRSSNESTFLALSEDYGSSSDSPPTPTLSLSPSEDHHQHSTYHHTSHVRGHSPWSNTLPPMNPHYATQHDLAPHPNLLRPSSPYPAHHDAPYSSYNPAYSHSAQPNSLVPPPPFCASNILSSSSNTSFDALDDALDDSDEEDEDAEDAEEDHKPMDTVTTPGAAAAMNLHPPKVIPPPPTNFPRFPPGLSMPGMPMMPPMHMGSSIPIPSPAMVSSFSPSYTNLLEMEDFEGMFDDDLTVSTDMIVPMPFIPMSPTELNLASIDELVRHYIQNVIGIEYLLADKSTLHHLSSQLVQLTAQGSPSVVGDAVRLLAAVHRNRARAPIQALEEPALKNQYRALQPLLLKDAYTTGEAFAALQIISAFLFDGGTGYRWHRWLKIACSYADSVLLDKKYTGPAEALIRADETVQFVVKTTMWFDVLASITLGVAPHFLKVFREIFNPNNNPQKAQPMRQLSMMAVMGCENDIVWALSEVSALAQWKQEQQKRGTLSVPELVRRGQEIERHLTPAPAAYCSDNLEVYRQYSSEIFRASTSVYLHSVVSGDFPAVPEIRKGVKDMIDCLNEIPALEPSSPTSASLTATSSNITNSLAGNSLATPSTNAPSTPVDPSVWIFSRSVIRMTVFSIFICGCLTDDRGQREALLSRLKQQQSLEKIGNCDGITELLEDVWKKRDSGPSWQEVGWREALNKAEMLLV